MTNRKFISWLTAAVILITAMLVSIAIVLAEYRKLPSVETEKNTSETMESNIEPETVYSGMLTWIDDDTWYGAYDKAHDLADELGIKITFACITNNLTDESTALLLQYQHEGFQVTTHSASHDNQNVWGSNYPGENVFDETMAENELVSSIEVLKNHGFQNCDYFVSPGCIEFDEVVQLARENCKGMVAGDFTGNINLLGSADPYLLRRVFIDYSAHPDAAYYEDLIDQAYANDGWVIFGTHSAETDQWNEDLIREVLQYAMDKGVRIKTLDDAFNDFFESADMNN